jgi:activator of 2-hydroxyglutaryl-CoA dehydratase
MITAGIDVGSAAIKRFLLMMASWSGRVADARHGLECDACGSLFGEGLADLSISENDVAAIATRVTASRCSVCSARKVKRDHCQCMGAHVASQGRARTIINIGGQDIKIIKWMKKARSWISS